MKNKNVELNVHDYEFLEALVEIKNDIINGVLSFIVQKQQDTQLIEYLVAWAERDHEHMDNEDIEEVIEKINAIKKEGVI